MIRLLLAWENGTNTSKKRENITDALHLSDFNFSGKEHEREIIFTPNRISVYDSGRLKAMRITHGDAFVRVVSCK